YDPPLVLYVKGELLAKDKNSVAMVGSRMTTHYGIEVARRLAYQLGYVGVTVVSGGARGSTRRLTKARSLRKDARSRCLARELRCNYWFRENSSSLLPEFFCFLGKI